MGQSNIAHHYIISLPGIKKHRFEHPMPPINENIFDTDGNISAIVEVMTSTISDIIIFLIILITELLYFHILAHISY